MMTLEWRYTSLLKEQGCKDLENKWLWTWGNQSIYLHRSDPLLENGLDRPNGKNRYGRYGFPSFYNISISTVGVDRARVCLWRFSFLALWVVVVVDISQFPAGELIRHAQSVIKEIWFFVAFASRVSHVRTLRRTTWCRLAFSSIPMVSRYPPPPERALSHLSHVICQSVAGRAAYQRCRATGGVAAALANVVAQSYATRLWFQNAPLKPHSAFSNIFGFQLFKLRISKKYNLRCPNGKIEIADLAVWNPRTSAKSQPNRP